MAIPPAIDEVEAPERVFKLVRWPSEAVETGGFWRSDGLGGPSYVRIAGFSQFEDALLACCPRQPEGCTPADIPSGRRHNILELLIGPIVQCPFFDRRVRNRADGRRHAFQTSRRRGESLPLALPHSTVVPPAERAN